MAKQELIEIERDGKHSTCLPSQLRVLEKQGWVQASESAVVSDRLQGIIVNPQAGDEGTQTFNGLTESENGSEDTTDTEEQS